MQRATPQERNILQLMASGNTTKEIAAILHISFHTVQAHRKSLLKKYDASNAVELIRKAATEIDVQNARQMEDGS
jgi:two-component system nitrate/nitrite response regulator NarL